MSKRNSVVNAACVCFNDAVKNDSLSDLYPFGRFTVEKIRHYFDDDLGEINCFLTVDFADHRTLNWFMKLFFSVVKSRGCKTIDHKDFLSFVERLEQCATICDRIGCVDMETVISRLTGNRGYILSRLRGDNISLLGKKEYDELCKYVWDEKHPFNYSINVTKPNEEGECMYYVVFNSAPVYKG